VISTWCVSISGAASRRVHEQGYSDSRKRIRGSHKNLSLLPILVRAHSPTVPQLRLLLTGQTRIGIVASAASRERHAAGGGYRPELSPHHFCRLSSKV
jgi:hypothetical protein